MKRIERVRELMKDWEIDGLLVYSPYNLRYLSNFTGTTGYALITLDKAFFVTDARYTEQAKNQAADFEVCEHKQGWIPFMKDILLKEDVQSLGFEADHITVSTLEILEEEFLTRLVPTSGIVETLREVKDEEELSIIRKACSISDAAFLHILNFIKPGKTEIEVANELDFFMRKQGAKGVSFDTIVASGYRSAMPHGVASEKEIQMNELVTLDFGCYYQGYASDMTRTIAVGDPGDLLKEIYDITLQAQLKVIEAAAPGKTGKELDLIARDYIQSKGYGDKFVHSTGHGLGLEVHESPSVHRLAEQAFVTGNVITDEPGIYLPGIGGVRIEDDLIITDTGCEVIQKVTKEFIVL